MDDSYDRFAWIDRLATGELDDGARRELFTWLDGEPQRWRRCALALLETREIEQALVAWQSETRRPAVKLLTPPAGRSRRGAVFALAASVLVAFGLGLFARGYWAGDGQLIADLPAAHHDAGGDPVQASSGIATTSDAAAIDTADIDITSNKVTKQSAPPPRQTAAAAEAPTDQRRDSIPSYIRGQWERRGYQLSSRPAQLPVVLPDGRRLMASVDEWQLNYVGQRTY